jgi:L-alanine-DL-glutamate epimerase-like enolase superfamily enzyme
MTTDTIVDSVETWACSIPLLKPLSFGNFTVTSREYAAVRILTRGGLVADCLGHTRRSPVDVAISDLLAPRLLGKDAVDGGERLSDLTRATLAIEQDGVIGRARSLIDICLWDIRAQVLGVPVWRLLGGHPRGVSVALVEGYAVEGENEDDLITRLLARTSEGYRFFKVEAAHYGHPEPVRRILSAVRSETEATFTCDLAWSWQTARQGLAAAAAWEGLGIAWIEDPMPRERLSEMAFLRQHSRIPIGVGDEVTRVADLDRLMDGGCIDVLRVDATTIGGFSAALALAEKGTRRGFRVSYHVNPEVHRHCIFSNDATDHIEIFPADRPFDCSHVVIEEPSFDTIRNGIVRPPESLGTGLRLNDEALARFAYRHSEQRLPNG